METLYNTRKHAMILFGNIPQTDSELSWIAIEDFDEYEDTRDSGVLIYEIKSIEDGCLYDNWVPSLRDAEKILDTDYGVDISSLISTKEMVLQGYDMSKYNDPDYPT